MQQKKTLRQAAAEAKAKRKTQAKVAKRQAVKAHAKKAAARAPGQKLLAEEARKKGARSDLAAAMKKHGKKKKVQR